MNNKELHKHNMKQLRQAFSLIEFSPLGDYGVNCILPGRVVSAYWKKGKYGDSRTQQWKLFIGVKGLINIINMLLMPEPEPQAKEPEPGDIGTQACIDHIKAKIKTIEAGNRRPDCLTILLALTQELQQFL